MSGQRKKAKSKSKSGRDKRSNSSSWADPERVVNKAQSVVNSAVNVLHDEIAAGILAAKKIERKLIDVDEIRSNPDDLMNRIRRDSHEALDLYIDAFAALNSKLNTLIDSLKTTESEESSSTFRRAAKKREEVIVVEADKVMKPGENTKIKLTMFDDGSGDSNKIELRKSDFLGPRDQKINLRAIQIKPKTLTLRANQEKEVTLVVNLPKNAKPGRYNALITDVYNPLIRIVLSIDVTS